MTGAVKEQSPLKQIPRICSINHQLLLPEKLERPGSIWYQRMVPIGNQSLRTDLIRMAIQRESSLLKAEARRKEAINRSRTPTPSLQSLLICRVPLALWKGPTGLPQLLRFVQRSKIFDNIDRVSNSSIFFWTFYIFVYKVWLPSWRKFVQHCIICILSYTTNQCFCGNEICYRAFFEELGPFKVREPSAKGRRKAPAGKEEDEEGSNSSSNGSGVPGPAEKVAFSLDPSPWSESLIIILEKVAFYLDPYPWAFPPGGSLAANDFKQRTIHGQQSEGKTTCSAEGHRRRLPLQVTLNSHSQYSKDLIWKFKQRKIGQSVKMCAANSQCQKKYVFKRDSA